MDTNAQTIWRRAQKQCKLPDPIQRSGWGLGMRLSGGMLLQKIFKI